MIDKIKYAVIDTNILVGGIIEEKGSSSTIVELLEQNIFKLAITKPIFEEYIDIFENTYTASGIRITNEHRKRLEKIVIHQAHSLKCRTSTGKLSDLGHTIYNGKGMHDDYKFLVAADELAGETFLPGILISNDFHITNHIESLRNIGILAFSAFTFLQQYLPSHSH